MERDFFRMVVETDDLEDDTDALRSVGALIPRSEPKEGGDWKIVDIDSGSTMGIYFQLVVPKGWNIDEIYFMKGVFLFGEKEQDFERNVRA